MYSNWITILLTRIPEPEGNRKYFNRPQSILIHDLLPKINKVNNKTTKTKHLFILDLLY